MSLHPMEFVRRVVFRMSQARFGALVGTDQAVVSRWESDNPPVGRPSRAQLEILRKEAAKRGLPWNDSWIFETPRGAQKALAAIEAEAEAAAEAARSKPKDAA